MLNADQLGNKKSQPLPHSRCAEYNGDTSF